EANPSVARMTQIVVLGNLARIGAFVFLVLVFAFGILFLGLALAGLSFTADFDTEFEQILTAIPTVVLTLSGLAIYFLIFLVWNALTHALLILPMWRHYALTLTMTGTDYLTAITQRARDEHREAEGFAEALDVGAAL
ncbi:MAG: hypothetical protein ACU0DW_12930, partial [Shimia sp.]